MAKQWKRVAASVTAAVMAGSMVAGLAACGDSQPYEIEKRERTGWKDEKVYTYNDYTAQMPDVWNEIFTSDNTNISLAGYLNSSFFEYDYQYENGNIVEGGFTVAYSAATKLEDVTAKYVGQYGITADMAEEGHHAFAITLRNDLKWDDGTAIKAEDFVYTMSQQLSPKYLFETASNYYSGNYVLHNAKEYLYQGQSGHGPGFQYGSSYEADKSSMDFHWTTGYYADMYAGSYSPAELIVAFGGFTGVDSVETAQAFLDAWEGKKIDECLADTGLMKTFLEEFWFEDTNRDNWDYDDLLYFCEVDYIFPEMDFSQVGYFVGENDYELVIVVDNTLSPLDGEGNLTYEAAYYLQSFPLVKKSLWESCENKSASPWTNTYCSGSIANSASWGPYKLSVYQSGVTYTLERNTEWYGYNMEKYDDQFQTDRIVTRYVPEWNTAWQMFQKGEIDSIGMDVSIAEQYRNSRQAYFTPETWTFSLNLQTYAESRTADRNNLLLKYDDFRKAVSLALNRDDFCAKNSPSSQPALGYLNNMYYYDVENGGVYRDTVQAKEAILHAYGAEKTEGGWKVGTVEYDDLDEAVDAVTGYNLTLARQLMTSAYNAAVEAGDYTKGEKIVLTYGVEKQTSTTDRVKKWFQSAFDNATKGTPLEGKIKIEYFFFSSATWSEQFMDGEYDLCFGAWGNAPFNPYYLFGETQIADANRYAQGWDPSTIELTITLQGDDTHPGGDFTLNLADWNDCMQGKSGAKYNFSLYPVADQLTILGALEAEVLQQYWAIPVYSRYSASLMGYKCDYVSYEYNTFMGYGGIQYMTYHFDDTEWAEFVKEHKGKLNYRFGRED
ncbi:MAG: ABC transporter substrate-binding protein [Candidatus Gallimonas sp.]